MTLHQRLILFGGRLPEELQEAYRALLLRTYPRAGDNGRRLAPELLEGDRVLVLRAAAGATVRLEHPP